MNDESEKDKREKTEHEKNEVKNKVRDKGKDLQTRAPTSGHQAQRVY